MEPGGMSPVFGFPVMGAQVPSAYRVAPTTENPTQAAGYPAAPAARLPEAVRVGVDGTAGKKKRGRPRKYGPGGTVPMAPLAAVPISCYAPATSIFASSSGKTGGEGSGGLEDNQRMKAPKVSPNDFCMEPGGMSPELFGFPVMGAEAPSAYHVAPTTENPENPTQAAGYPAAPAAGLPEAVTVGVDGTAGKRKRGRPRKYGPGGTVPMAPLPAVPVSSYAPSTVIRASGSRKTGSGYLEDKQRMKPPRVPSDIGEENWSAIVTPCVNYMEHRRILKPSEDVASLLVRTRIKNMDIDLCILSASGVLSKITLRKRDSPTGMITHKGQFKILKLNGGLVRNGGQRNTVGGITITAEDKSNGRVIAGAVVGHLLAATPVEVVYATFGQEEPYGIQNDSMPEAAPNAAAPPANIPPVAAPAPNIAPAAAPAPNIAPAAAPAPNIAPVAAPAANIAPAAAPAAIIAHAAAPAAIIAPAAAPPAIIAPVAALDTNMAPNDAPATNIAPAVADVSNDENVGQGDQNPGAPSPNLGSCFPFPGENDATKDPMQESPNLAVDVQLAWLRNHFGI